MSIPFLLRLVLGDRSSWIQKEPRKPQLVQAVGMTIRTSIPEPSNGACSPAFIGDEHSVQSCMMLVVGLLPVRTIGSLLS